MTDPAKMTNEELAEALEYIAKYVLLPHADVPKERLLEAARRLRAGLLGRVKEGWHLHGMVYTPTKTHEDAYTAQLYTLGRSVKGTGPTPEAAVLDAAGRVE
jgi:hypothetical protein